MSIDRLLATATGPSKLRSDLRLQTKPVRSVLKVLETVRSVGAEMSASILGSQFCVLMSDRLKQQLLSLEQSQNSMETVSPKRLRLTSEASLSLGLSTISPSLSFEKELKSQLISQDPALQRRETFFPQPSPSQVAKEPTGQIPPPHPEVGKQQTVAPFSSPKQIVVETDLWNLIDNSKKIDLGHGPDISINPGEGLSLAGKNETMQKIQQSKPENESLLVRKLNNYWQFSQLQRVSEAKASHKNNKVAEKSARNIPSAVSLPNTIVSKSWPELTGQEVARNVRSIVRSQPTTGPSTSLPAKRSEKVEIQNVFNLEVNSRLGGGEFSMGELSNLSDKLADILREQALQHGIDIT